MSENMDETMEPLKIWKSHFFYLRRADRHPIGVVALRRVSVDTVTIAASLCSPEDPWDRTAGVNKAVGKLNSPDHSMTVTFMVADWPSIVNDLGDRLAEETLEHLFPKPQPRGKPGGAWTPQSPVIRHGVDLEHAQKMLTKQLRYMLTPKAEPDAVPALPQERGHRE